MDASVVTKALPSAEQPQPQSTMNRRVLWIAAALVALTTVVFAPLRDHGFTNYDDGAYVTENAHVIGGISWQNATWAFSFDSCADTGNWHPLTWLSLMTDVTMFGLNPTGFHLENLAIHVANVLLLFIILIRMTGAVGKSAVVAAVFAVHPLHVESVAWISERKDVLSTLFALLTIWTYVRYVATKLKKWNILSLCLLVLSLMSKQMYVTLPFLLLLLDYWPLQRLTLATPDSAGEGDVGQHAWRLVTEKLSFLLVAIIFCLIAFVGQKTGHAVGTFEDFPFVQRCLNAAISYVVYLWQTVWPAGLAVFYPYPNHSLWGQATGACVILAGITAYTVKVRIRHPYLIVGWLWYLGTLAPVIGIVQIGRQRMADRYMYFPMIGLLVGIVWLASSWAAGERRREAWFRRAAFLVIAALACAARVQTSYWKDTLTLFTRAADVAESSLAYTKLGYERGQLGQFDAATNLFHRALQLEPDYVAAHNCLGNTCLAEGDLQQAIQHFRRTIELDRDNAEAYYNLGIAYSGLGQLSEAVEHYEAALRINSSDASVHTNLAIAFLMLRQNSPALRHLQRALEIKPDLPEAHFTLGSFFVSISQEAEAIVHFRKVLETRPDKPEVHRELARLYLQQGETELADHHRQRAGSDRNGPDAAAPE